VLFKIGEGPLVGIEKIRFKGNATFDEDDLADHMQTEENGWFTTGKFDETVFQEDLVSLLTFYRTKGFLDAEVVLGDVRYSADKTELHLEVVIQEGQRYTVDKIVFEGNKLFSNAELTHRMTLQAGQPYDAEKKRNDQRKIQEMYADNAHITVRVLPNLVYASTGTSLSVVYQIGESQRIYVERVEFEGNTVTQSRVIRRQMRIHPGDPFSYRKVRQSRRLLLSLNYFDAIDFDVRETEERTANARDLFIKLKEGRTGIIRFAVGVTSNAGVLGEISLTKRNFDISRWPKSFDDLINGNAFSGAGQFFTIQLQPGTELNRFRIAFREPHVNDGPYSFGTEIQAYQRSRETFDERRIGGTLSSGRQITDRLRTDWRYRAENISIDDLSSDAPRIVREVRGSNFLASLIFGLTYDRTNDPLLPSKGYRVGGGLEISSQAVGSDFDYTKLNLRGSYYYTPWKTTDLLRTQRHLPHVIAINSRLGFGFETGSEIPVFSRFFAGGFGSVRGFRFRTISPKDAGEPFGGKFLALLSIQYSAPIYQDALRAVIFADIGSVADGFGSLSGELRASVGLGVRLKIPFLGPRPIALDFGFPIRKQTDDETEVFSFSIGRSF